MFRDHLPFSDAFVLKMIIHDWDDPRCISVLRNCCKQLDANGRVICIDAVLPPLGDTSDAPGKLLYVNMMLVLPGKERTRAEWEALYHEAGLELRAVIPIPDTFGTCIVEGRKKLA
jgi:O-methyltransferase domain